MKIVALGARLLLGVGFVFFGLNGLFHLVKLPPMPPAATRWMAAMPPAYLQAVFGTQLACGALLTVGLFVPLALVVIAPVIVNVLLFHATMAPSGLVPGVVLAALWGVVAMRAWPALAPLVRPTVRR